MYLFNYLTEEMDMGWDRWNNKEEFKLCHRYYEDDNPNIIINEQVGLDYETLAHAGLVCEWSADAEIDDTTKNEFKGLKQLLDEADQKDEYIKAIEKEIEESFRKVFRKGFPIKSGIDLDNVELEDEDILEDLDYVKGFELTPDPWFDPVMPKIPFKKEQPKCECGLGTNEPSQQHYEWCCCYTNEEE